jgi:hypothetical protein
MDIVMNNQPEKYHAYMLRLWSVEGNGERAWRATLENVHTGERRGFSSWGALISFLQEFEKAGQEPERPANSSYPGSSEVEDFGCH